MELLLGVGVPQHHAATVGHTAQQGAPQRGQLQVMDGLEERRVTGTQQQRVDVFKQPGFGIKITSLTN